jgi:type IV secretion system protein TrbL
LFVPSKKVTCLWVLAIETLLVQAVLAQNFTTTVPTDILAQYKQARQIWSANIFVYANSLFGILALIEFAWSAAVMLLEKTDLQSWTSALVRKIMWIGAFYALLLNAANWIPAIIDSFNQIGSNAAGIAVTLSPGDIFSQGLTIAGALMDAASGAGFFTNPGTSLAMAFAALLIVISYIIITINFVVTVVESYIVVSVGFIFLGFGGSRWTAPYVERFIGLAVAIGVKIVLLYCLIATGLNLGAGWLAEAQGIGNAPHPNMSAFDVMGAALILMMLCWQIPKLFSAVLGGSPALTGGDLIGAGMGLGAAAVTVGAVTAGGVGALAGGVAALAGGRDASANGPSGASAASSVTSVGASGSSSVSPPPAPGSGAASATRQPDPPTSGLSAIGGDPLPGSGFESERPSRGSSTASSVQSVAGNASEKLRSMRRRLGPIPTDAAPHVSPPRMPIDHSE